VRNAECGTTVIGPLSLVIGSGKEQAGGTGGAGTAKMADGGRRPGTGNGEKHCGLRIESTRARRGYGWMQGR